MNNLKIIITSPGGAGKDFLKKVFVKHGFKPSVSYTSRPPRTGEINGIDYHFITEAVFKQMICNDEFEEYNIFGPKKWYYGTTEKEFKTSNVFIMTPSGIKSIPKKDRNKYTVIYLNIPVEVRKERLNNRKDSDNTERRLKTDLEDFKDFKDFDICITDPFFIPEDVVNSLLITQ